MMRVNPIDLLLRQRVPNPVSAVFTWRSQRSTSSTVVFRLRAFSELPFYCHPAKLFFFTWMLMLTALSFHVTDVSYPNLDLPLELFAISAVSFLLGYSIIRISYLASGAPQSSASQSALNVTRLRRVNALFAIVALAIMLLNYKLDGLPPVLGLFSFDTAIYLEYGRIKQLLFPLLVSIFVNAFLDRSWYRKSFFSGFALLSMLAYVTRGNVLTALLQVLLVFSMRTRISKRKLYLVAVVVGIAASVAADLIGNTRTPQAIFLAFLQIKRSFSEWPMIYLWTISYFSVPLSNMCWIVTEFNFDHITWSFLYPALPAFWTPSDPHASLLNSSHIIDGVHTYLANYYLDFFFPGIILINALLGVCSAFLVGYGITRHFLTSAVFLSCIAYIFFVDNFTPLSTILQFVMQLFVQRYIFSWVKNNGAPNASHAKLIAA